MHLGWWNLGCTCVAPDFHTNMTSLTQRGAASASVCSHFGALTVFMQLSFNPPYKPFRHTFNASKTLSTVKTITLGKRVLHKNAFFRKLHLEPQPFINCLYNSIPNSFLLLNVRAKHKLLFSLLFFSFNVIFLLE